MITEHREGRFTMRPGVYTAKRPSGHRAAVLNVYGFTVDEGGEVRVLATNTAVRPLARTVARHYYVPTSTVYRSPS